MSTSIYALNLFRNSLLRIHPNRPSQPWQLPDGNTKCFVTGKAAQSWGLFGRTY
jgi:hypothetical protein